MKLPRIPWAPGKARQELVAMGGLNYSDQFREGDLRDARNLSARRWPYLTTRKGRSRLANYQGVTALAGWDKLVAVQGTDLLLDGVQVGTVTPGEKQFAVVNTKLVIWPDKVYLDMEDSMVKPLGASLTLPAGAAVFSGDVMELRDSVLVPLSESEQYDPAHPTWKKDGFMAEKLNDFPYVMRVQAVTRTATGLVPTGLAEVRLSALKVGDRVLLSADRTINWNWGKGYQTPHQSCYGVITDVNTVHDGYNDWRAYEIYEKLPEAANLLNLFKKGDGVTISGAGANNREAIIIQDLTAKKATFLGGAFEAGAPAGAVTLERKIPPLEFICESQNRLWGCEGHTIWSSTLGDPTNFYVYENASTDSYAVAVATDGAFTGCVGYSEGVLFWKEDCLHKVLGSYGANYELHTYGVPGVKAGCHKSQTVINDVLYYMGSGGVYAYGGGTPRLLPGGFGERAFSEGVGGSDGEKYYLSVKEGSAAHLLVYDIRKGLWLREDATVVRDFARLGKTLYFADHGGSVWQVDGGGEDPEQEWLARLCPFYESMTGRKKYSKLRLRLELPAGSWIVAEIRWDGGAWSECGKAVGRTDDVIPLQIRLNRCDKMELRLRGKGPCTVLSIQREFMLGSEK